MYPYYEKNNHSLLKIYPVLNEDFSFPPHLHSSVEFFYVLDGEIYCTVDNEQKLLKKGDCLLTFPNQIHSYQTENKSQSFLLLFNPYSIESFRRIFLNCHPESPFLTSEKLNPDIELAIQRLLDSKTCSNPHLSFGWLQIILSSIIPYFSLTKASTKEKNETLSRVLEYIMEHFSEPLTLDNLAHELHLNKFYLSHIISDQLQINFRDYLNTLRLDYAAQMIATTDMPLIDIWSSAGFECQATFNRIFKKHMHMTPSQYRKVRSRT